MRVKSYNFHVAQANPQSFPLVVVTVATRLGARVYTSVGLMDMELWNDPPVSGDLLIISIEPRVLSYGNMRDTGSILPTINLRGKRAREVGNMEVVLRNDDDYFGKLMSTVGGIGVGQANAFLGSTMSVAVGFRGLAPVEFLTRFQGVIQEHLLTREQFVLRAETA